VDERDISFESIGAEIDRLEAGLDLLEMDLIAQEVMKRRDLRCTAQVREAVHLLVEKYFKRWRAQHPRRV